MSAGHPNAIAYRRAADAFRSRDLAALDEVIDEHVVWHLPGRHARDLPGRDAVLEFLRGLAGKGFWLEEHDVFANDQHACALSVMGLENDSGRVSTRVVSVFHFAAGRQLERWFYPDDMSVWDAIAAA